MSVLRAISSATFFAVMKYVRLSRLAMRNSDEISFCFYSSIFVAVIARRNLPNNSLICSALSFYNLAS